MFKYFGFRIVSFLMKIYNQFIRLIFPNVMAIIFGRLKFASDVSPNQRIICEGYGIVRIGKNCSFGYRKGGFWRGGSIELQARNSNSRIIIGDNVATNNNVFVCAAKSITIGDNTLIGQNVTISDHEAHGINPEERGKVGKIGRVIIGENVWIGSNVTILKNSEIGKNSVVATGAVVSGTFPDNVIIGGIPAKIIRNL
jgi:acetyltransferase-like isoleucine patch superfamily enzyme